MDDLKAVKRINKSLSGQHGIVMLTGENRPKYLGTLKSVELKGSNVLFTFSEHKVLLFTPMSMLCIVGNEQKDGSFPGKEICDDLFIGNKSLSEIFGELQ